MTLVSVIQNLQNKTGRRMTFSYSSSYLELPENTKISLKTSQSPDFFISIKDGKDGYVVAEVKTFHSSSKHFSPSPIKPWRRAQHGTVEKYAGILSETIPGLRRISNDELDEDLEQMRK